MPYMQGENAFLDLPNVLLIEDGRKVLRTFELEFNLVVDHKREDIYLKAENDPRSREKRVPFPREAIQEVLEETELMIKKVKRGVDEKYHPVFSKFEDFIKNSTISKTLIYTSSHIDYFSLDFSLGLWGLWGNGLYKVLEQIPSSKKAIDFLETMFLEIEGRKILGDFSLENKEAGSLFFVLDGLWHSQLEDLVEDPARIPSKEVVVRGIIYYVFRIKRKDLKKVSEEIENRGYFTRKTGKEFVRFSIPVDLVAVLLEVELDRKRLHELYDIHKERKDFFFLGADITEKAKSLFGIFSEVYKDGFGNPTIVPLERAYEMSERILSLPREEQDLEIEKYLKIEEVKDIYEKALSFYLEGGFKRANTLLNKVWKIRGLFKKEHSLCIKGRETFWFYSAISNGSISGLDEDLVDFVEFYSAHSANNDELITAIGRKTMKIVVDSLENLLKDEKALERLGSYTLYRKLIEELLHSIHGAGVKPGLVKMEVFPEDNSFYSVTLVFTAYLSRDRRGSQGLLPGGRRRGIVESSMPMTVLNLGPLAERLLIGSMIKGLGIFYNGTVFKLSFSLDKKALGISMDNW